MEEKDDKSNQRRNQSRAQLRNENNTKNCSNLTNYGKSKEGSRRVHIIPAIVVKGSIRKVIKTWNQLRKQLRNEKNELVL